MTKSKKYIATPSSTVEIMQEYGITMKKSLGQNFLIEPNILQRMVEVAEISKETRVVEIGPGIGALTEFLALNAKEVLAFEIDQRFVEILSVTLESYRNVKIIHQDILEVDFYNQKEFCIEENQELVVVANLPYYITTPIIDKLIKSNLPFSRLVLLIQKEVAERMTARVGTKAYGSLTIAINNYMESEIAFQVPKTVFIPKPNVDSSVLKFTRRNHPLVVADNQEEFEEFVRQAFSQRRKTLKNNLRSLYKNQEDRLAFAFNQSQIDGNRRAETLTIHEFYRLYQCL